MPTALPTPVLHCWFLYEDSSPFSQGCQLRSPHPRQHLECCLAP
ncbi:rCG27317 [Rattus norvegicus]|uniref:RCG27317 n=1 Tax=Rattus norvegicus TaxID=10116 RepID=A6HNN5_RAT|nr:rCG27317 [Rattus norvegicus]